MPMRVALDRERDRTAPSAPSGFAPQPFNPPRAVGEETASAAAGAAASTRLAPTLPSGPGVQELLEPLTQEKLGPVTFEGDEHYVRYRLQNGRLELGINPEWQSLQEILDALEDWERHDQAISPEVQRLAELAQETNVILNRLDLLLRLRSNPMRQAAISETIESAQRLAWTLFQSLSNRTLNLDAYGGTLHGHGAEDTDVVGFDSTAVVEQGDLEDVSGEFSAEMEEGPQGSGAMVVEEALTKADGPPAPLDREGARQVRDVQQGGQPLPRELRTFYESRFRTSFAHVRLHADERGDLASRRLNARAFTLGHHIAIRRDQYRPQTAEGRWLIAHELAHALPAGRAGAAGPPRLGGARDRAEHTADRTADAVMAGLPVPALSAGIAGTAGAAADGVVRRAPPRGTYADPIKIALFKTKGMYKNFKATGYSGGQETFKPFQLNELPTPTMTTAPGAVGAPPVNKKIGGAGANVKGVKLGVQDPNNNVKGTVVKRIKSPNRRVEGIFKTALSGRGFNWAGFAPDHVHDLALSGPDRFDNLWPLDSTLNSHANKTYQQKVKYDDAGTVRTKSVVSLIGKYFMISRLRKP